MRAFICDAACCRAKKSLNISSSRSFDTAAEPTLLLSSPPRPPLGLLWDRCGESGLKDCTVVNAWGGEGGGREGGREREEEEGAGARDSHARRGMVTGEGGRSCAWDGG